MNERKYLVVDSKTGLIVATRSSLISARRKADKLDNEYGAVRYLVKGV